MAFIHGCGQDAVRRFIAYPIGHGPSDGPPLVNIIAETRERPESTANWNRRVDKAPIIDLFADWQFLWLDVPAVLQATEELLEYPMVDRDPLPTWTLGATTLLGDAAHAMYPVGSNGASQAILDARVLARELASHDPGQALVRYERERLPATRAVLEANRRGGPEQVMVLAAERTGGDDRLLSERLPRTEIASLMARYSTTAGFDASRLNARSSLSTAAPPST